MDIPTRIRRIRKEQGWTQGELADKLGVSRRTIQNYESGKIVPHRHFRELEQLGRKPAGWMEAEDDVHGHGWKGTSATIGSVLALLLPTPGVALSCHCDPLISSRQPRVRLATRRRRVPATHGQLRFRLAPGREMW